MTAGQDEKEMAENIQALIDFLGEHVLKYDLTHIKGEEIVNGNPEHCINLLQLVQEIAVMIQNKAPREDDQAQLLEAGRRPESDDEAPPPEDQREDEEEQFAEEDDDDLEQEFMQQLQNQPVIEKKEVHGADDEVDEDDLKMYE